MRVPGRVDERERKRVRPGMRKFFLTCLLGFILVGGGWALMNREEIQSPRDIFRLVTEQMNRFRAGRASGNLAAWSGPETNQEVIRIASFNIQAFGPTKASHEQVLPYLAAICRNFDLIAVQEIRGSEQAMLPHFVNLINQGQSTYGFVISPPLGRSDSYREQTAFILNQATVQLDNAYAYTLQDPDDVMIREPFVGWFRAVRAKPEAAFTFSLVNLHLDSRRANLELPYLEQVFRAVRKDGRGEDDVLLIGDFNAGERGIERSFRRTGLVPVLKNTATNTRGNRQYDNLILDLRATREFTGRSGVFDFLREFNLTMEQALEISDHLPVWAEFSILEGAGAPPGAQAGAEAAATAADESDEIR